MTFVPPGTVADTTGAAGVVPVRVAARLAEPVVALASHTAPLDGPLSWGAYAGARAAGIRIPPMTADWCVDFALPLATWTRPASAAGTDPRLGAAGGGQVWGWACSAASYAIDADTAVQIRRRPATAEMARFTGERRHHLGLGPYKARDVTLPAVATREITWWALATDPDRVAGLLGHVTHLGRHTRHGHGRVLAWNVTEDPDAAARWEHRPMPDPGGRPGKIRAPYWHHSREMPCR